MPCSLFEMLESRVCLSAVPAAGNWNLYASFDFNAPPAAPTWVNTLWGHTHFAGELESYQPANASASDGVASLTARQETAGGMPYTSGIINTGGNTATSGSVAPSFSFQYGYIEASMKLVSGTGFWTGFWMLPTPDANGYHDQDGEIDIMEQIGSDPTSIAGSLHHDPTNRTKDFHSGVDLSAGFHTYGVDWEPDHITWYFDHSPYLTVTSDVPNVPMYVILNLAIGDATSWAGTPDATTPFPTTMQVDYVRAYKSVPPAIGGDANFDGKVDVGDLGTVATYFGVTSGATWTTGDFTADGRVDVADLGVFATNYGFGTITSGSAGASSPVAMPATMSASTLFSTNQITAAQSQSASSPMADLFDGYTKRRWAVIILP
jgi:beta-glucanase (GH16 family)